MYGQYVVKGLQGLWPILTTWREEEEELDAHHYILQAQYLSNNLSETFKYSLHFMHKFKLWSPKSKGWSEYNTTFVTWHGRVRTVRLVQITHLTPRHSEFYCVGNNDGSWAGDEVVEKLARSAQTERDFSSKSYWKRKIDRNIISVCSAYPTLTSLVSSLHDSVLNFAIQSLSLLCFFHACLLCSRF